MINRKSIKLNNIKKLYKKECQIKSMIKSYETEYVMKCDNYDTDFCTYMGEDIEILHRKLKLVQKKQNSRLCKILDDK